MLHISRHLEANNRFTDSPRNLIKLPYKYSAYYMAAVLLHIHIRNMIMQKCGETETKTKSSLEIWLRLHNFA